MQFTFGDKGEVHLLDESVLPVTEKERKGEGKSSIGPRMKYGHPNLKLNIIESRNLVVTLTSKKG